MDTAATLVAVDSQVSERRRHLILLLLLAGLLLVVGLGTLGLTDQDEGRNAEAGREMLESGNWVSPTFNYQPRFTKPALLYWLMSGTYSLFGVDAFSARLPAAGFGVALVLLQYGFLTRVYGAGLGLLGALMLLLNLLFVVIARMAKTDGVLMFFTTLAVFGFWLGLHGDRRARYALWGFYVGMALATLTKGPVGVLIPLVGVVPYLTLTRRWGQFWRHGFPLAGPVLFLVLTLPWYAAMLSIHGAAYASFGQAHTVGRFLNPMEGHGGTILFYLPVLFVGFFPWSAFLPMALVQAFQAWRRDRRGWITRGDDPPVDRPPTPAELEIFSAIWLVGGLVVFSLSATRLPHYIAPLFPPAALLAACYVQRCLTNPATPGARVAFRLIMGLGALMGGLLAAAPLLYAQFRDQIVNEFPVAADVGLGISPLAMAIVLLAGSGMIGALARSPARWPGIPWVAGSTIGFVVLIGLHIGVPRFNHYFIAPPQDLAALAGEWLGPEDRLIEYGRSKASVVFYAKRKVISIHPGEEAVMRPWLAKPGVTMILLPTRLRARLPEEARHYTILQERYGYLLLSNQPVVGGSNGSSSAAAAGRGPAPAGALAKAGT